MKAVKWFLVVSALVSVILITAPKDGFVYDACEHVFDYNNPDACHVYHCKKCGEPAEGHAQHSWKRIGCSTMYCTICGKSAPANHYYESVDCTNKWICRICNKVVYSHYARHPDTNRVDYVDCRYEVRCTKCNELVQDGIEHNWSTYKKHQNAHCLDCGIAAPAHMEHNLFSSFFGFIGICKDCGHVAFQIPSVRYVCAFIGLLMGIAGLVFLIVNRKRIRVPGGKYFQIATPEAHYRDDELRKHMF